ncbi:MAG: hypothetical protein ACP5G2_00070 [Candidatus Bipolaricaulaceae bacterium]
MDRARELSLSYADKPGVIGVYVVGSASRPFRDGLSDYDIEVAMEDAAYAATALADRHVFAIQEGPPRRVDHEFFLRPWSELTGLEQSSRDVDHYPFQYARILHDPDRRLARLFAQLAALPEEVRRLRLRIHYLETVFALGRADRCLDRDKKLGLRLVLGQGGIALTKLLAVARGSWAPTLHWAADELQLLGVPEDLISRAAATLADPTRDGLRELREAVHAFLDQLGLSFHHDRLGLIRWAYLTEEGKQAFSTWGSG